MMRTDFGVAVLGMGFTPDTKLPLTNVNNTSGESKQKFAA